MHKTTEKPVQLIIIEINYNLPRVLSGHNNYWYWGAADTNFTTVIVIGSSKDDLLKICNSVEQVNVIQSKYAIPYENNLPVFICSKFKLPFNILYQKIRFFI